MAIILRNGAAADFDQTKMRTGELAVVTDSKELHVTFSPGDSPKVVMDGEAIPAPETAGTEGQILRTDANGDPEWADVGTPTDAQVETAVTDWLDEHPEATTTVQDGAITYAKLNASLQGTVDDVSDLKSELSDTGNEPWYAWASANLITEGEVEGGDCTATVSRNKINTVITSGQTTPLEIVLSGEALRIRSGTIGSFTPETAELIPIEKISSSADLEINTFANVINGDTDRSTALYVIFYKKEGETVTRVSSFTTGRNPDILTEPIIITIPTNATHFVVLLGFPAGRRVGTIDTTYSIKAVNTAAIVAKVEALVLENISNV